MAKFLDWCSRRIDSSIVSTPLRLGIRVVFTRSTRCTPGLQSALSRKLVAIDCLKPLLCMGSHAHTGHLPHDQPGLTEFGTQPHTMKPCQILFI